MYENISDLTFGAELEPKTRSCMNQEAFFSIIIRALAKRKEKIKTLTDP